MFVLHDKGGTEGSKEDDDRNDNEGSRCANTEDEKSRHCGQ